MTEKDVGCRDGDEKKERIFLSFVFKELKVPYKVQRSESYSTCLIKKIGKKSGGSCLFHALISVKIRWKLLFFHTALAYNHFCFKVSQIG